MTAPTPSSGPEDGAPAYQDPPTPTLFKNPLIYYLIGAMAIGAATSIKSCCDNYTLTSRSHLSQLEQRAKDCGKEKKALEDRLGQQPTRDEYHLQVHEAKYTKEGAWLPGPQVTVIPYDGLEHEFGSIQTEEKKPYLITPKSPEKKFDPEKISYIKEFGPHAKPATGKDYTLTPGSDPTRQLIVYPHNDFSIRIPIVGENPDYVTVRVNPPPKPGTKTRTPESSGKPSPPPQERHSTLTPTPRPPLPSDRIPRPAPQYPHSHGPTKTPASTTPPSSSTTPSSSTGTPGSTPTFHPGQKPPEQRIVRTHEIIFESGNCTLSFDRDRVKRALSQGLDATIQPYFQRTIDREEFSLDFDEQLRIVTRHNHEGFVIAPDAIRIAKNNRPVLFDGIPAITFRPYLIFATTIAEETHDILARELRGFNGCEFKVTSAYAVRPATE